MKVLFLLLIVVSVYSFESKEAWNQLKSLFTISVKGGAMFNPKKDEIAYISNKDGKAQIYVAPFINGNITTSTKICIHYLFIFSDHK
jgi:hypothetical protein